MSKDLYETLKVDKKASQEEIKRAFKKLALQSHPDKCQNENDKGAKEEEFKKINEAYSILSDAEKRDKYDKFGMIDDNGGHGGVSMNDVFAQMFGGGGGMPGGGFSFVYMDGDTGGMPGLHNMHGFPSGFDSIFGGGHRHHGRNQTQCDVIDVKIGINDIYYGKTKKVEFEMLEKCDGCHGSGAQDPSHILKCMTCHGTGKLMQQMGPFMVPSGTCHTCNGNGTYVQHNKHCTKCKGKKAIYNKKLFELKLPKGIPNNFEVNMSEKGAYNYDTQKANDIKFRFIYDIKEPYAIDRDKNVHYFVSITLEELLGGFVKEVDIYNEKFYLVSEYYFNPTQSVVIKDKGLYDMETEKQRDLFISFKVEYGKNERLTKYIDVIRKVVKTSPDKSKLPENEDNVNSPYIIVISKDM
jgi:DnaJ-class molecular chaperone